MALNFPPVDALDGNPTNGMIWTSPEGRQWKYDSTIPGWRSLAPTGNSNIVYRGGLDLTEDPNVQYTDIEAGNQFAVVVGANPVDGTLYPGLAGKDIEEGSIVMYDGNEWQLASAFPYATEDVPGIVELADANEAIADPLVGRVVMTPERTGELIDVMVPQAEMDVKGKTRYATKNEADTGTFMHAALTPYSIGNILARLHRLEFGAVPTGMVSWFPAKNSTDIPSGYMICDGSRIYDQGDTADLYQALRSWGNPWGNSPSSDVVKLPDLRGRFIRGYHYDTGRDPDSAAYGSAQDDTYMSHTHGVIDSGHDHRVPGYVALSDANEDDHRIIIDDDYFIGDKREESTEKAFSGISINPAGQSETKPKNISLTPVIKL